MIAMAGRMAGRALLLGLALVLATPLPAEVLRVEIERRELVLDGHLFGAAGAYEKLVGRIYVGLDPTDPANAAIVDLEHAVRNAAGQVEVWADFMVLQPVDPALRRGVGWLEVSNRGGKASLRYFNRAGSAAADPTLADDFGDGLLLREGLTLIWVGWQWDVPERPGALRVRVPLVRGPGGEAIEGLARSDWTVDAPADTLAIGHRGHRPYAPADPEGEGHVLTVREGRDAPRTEIERTRWQFVRTSDDAPYPDAVTLDGGFEAGRIYELVYRARDPRPVGVGLAVVRDVMSYAKYGVRSEFPVNRGIAFGVSQTGRFLRHYLYEGFNVDEGGRKVFDGMLIHTAGAGRGSFNHRFAQPSRDAHRYSAFFYPTDLYPFASRPQEDPFTGRNEGLLDRTPDAMRPRTFVTNTGYEYWGRAASLVHTSVDGFQDVAPMPTERIYHLAGGQHFVGPFPPSDDDRLGAARIWRGNPTDFLFTLRALASRLVAWVADGTDPPASKMPRVADGTLVPPAALALPGVPGLEAPGVAHLAYRADYGPRFLDEGIIERQPPELGPAFASLVPQVDGLGNELGGVRGVELRVPLATYTPWATRAGLPGPEGELRDFVGLFAPFAVTDAQGAAVGDGRPSIQRLYGSRAAYLRRVDAAAHALVDEGFLLEEDVPRAVARARALWEWIVER